MSILGFDTILENAGESVNFNKSVDVENGGVEEAMEECALAIHAIFEAMYSNDSSEISAVTESAISGEEIVSEGLNTKGLGTKIGGAIKSAYETMKNAVLKVINGFIELVNKLKLDSKKFVAQVARSEKASEVKISGYTFPSSSMNFSLSVCFSKFASAVGAYGAIDFAIKNNSAENLSKVFSEKKTEGLKSVKEYLGGDDFKKAAFGEKKERGVRDAIAKDKIDKNPVSNSEVYITKKGDTLCYDTISGRYFKSDIDKIKKIENELNRRLISEMYISLNEFYYELGLQCTKTGNDLGWNVGEGLIDIRFSAQISEDNTFKHQRRKSLQKPCKPSPWGEGGTDEGSDGWGVELDCRF